jgi:hypothetical protein
MLNTNGLQTKDSFCVLPSAYSLLVKRLGIPWHLQKISEISGQLWR